MDATELIAALEADPDLRRAAQRLILGDTLLGLPALVAENSRQIAELRQAVAELRQAVAENSRQIAELRQAVSELRHTAEEQGRQIADVARRADATWGDLSGLRLEIAYREHTYGYFGDLLRKARPLTARELAELLDATVNEDRLSQGHAREVALADIVVTGTQQGSPGYLVVEVSRTIASSDVRRAQRRASLLASAGLSARPVVAGKEASEAVTDEAALAGVSVVLDGHLLEDDQ